MTDLSKKIAVAADHAGFALKKALSEQLSKDGYEVVDLGTHNEDRVDYPDFGKKLADEIASGRAARGIGICGSGIGISIALNRNSNVRAARCCDVTDARLAREHNDANVLVLGQRTTGIEVALDCLKIFLNTPFAGGRHADRVKKLGC